MSPEPVRFVVDSEEFFGDLFGQTSVSDGAIATFEETTVTLTGHASTKQFGTEIVVALLISVSQEMAIDLVAQWLLEKIGRSARHIRYSGATYDINIAGISRLLKRLKSEQKHR